MTNWISTISLILSLLLNPILFFSTPSYAKDEFERVRCGTDIPKAFIGKQATVATIVSTEQKYQSIGLKHLGSDGADDDPYSLVFWEICKNDYVWIVDRRKNSGVITDVLSIPSDDKDYPQSLPGHSCEKDGKRINDHIFTILEKVKDTQKVPVRKAWRIDLETMKFVSVPTRGIQCDNAHLVHPDRFR